MLETIAILIGAVLIVVGIAGSILPVLPGPPLGFAGLLLLAAVKQFSPPLTPTLITIMGIATLVVSALDYVIPFFGVRKYGASKWGVWGSVVGMVIGLFYPPFGMIIGAFVGAVLAEWLVKRKGEDALRAGWGAFIGTLTGIVLKLVLSGIMVYYFVRVLFQG